MPRGRQDLGGPVWLVVKTFLIFLLSQLIASFVVVFFLALRHQGVDAAKLLDNSILGQFFYVAIAEIIAAGSVLAILRHRRLPASFIGLCRRPKLSDLGHALGGFAVFYLLLIIGGVLVSYFLPGINTDQKQDLGFNNLITTSDNIFAFLALVIVPPLGEEPLVRGYLFSGLRARWRFWPAAILTSLLFGVAHLEFGNGQPLVWAAGIDTFLLSLVLVYLRESTGALYAGILVHIVNNLIAFSVQFK
ncbi:MAG TPA: type II CAAX endopeptidase family protein [Candidatus Saccharimonadales bacterium]|nr:type II CAAX endopeptidase family protein [Candidatus Saccharimonadales bacterium]